MFHWRVITEVDSTTPEQFYARDLAQYEPRDEDVQRFVKEFLSGTVDEWLNDGTSPMTDDVQAEEDIDSVKYLNFARTLARSQKTMTPRPPKRKCTGADEEDTPEDKQINFDLLSAVAIRRYKKFFKLPNRSGANPKNQASLWLLDGIHDHAESVPVDASGTAAYFLHVLRNKKNRLDHPDTVSL
ncbi:Histone deacetylase complex subunit SAP30 [Aphelenchoides avenae]|nr:Histone deacetylase complex subunit SAP30 [Aphelenchus avenae]